MSAHVGVYTVAKADFVSQGAGAYAAGNVIGSAQQLVGVSDFGGRIIKLDQIFVRDAAAQKKGFRLCFFDPNPPAVADNAAFAFGATLPNLIGLIDMSDGDFANVDTAAVISQPLLLKMKPSTPNVYVVCICKPDSGAPTYGVGGKLSFDFHFSY